MMLFACSCYCLPPCVAGMCYLFFVLLRMRVFVVIWFVCLCYVVVCLLVLLFLDLYIYIVWGGGCFVCFLCACVCGVCVWCCLLVVCVD